MVITKFKLKSGNFEVEMEGEQEYIDKKFAEISEKIFSRTSQSLPSQTGDQSNQSNMDEQPIVKTELEGIIEYGTDGVPRLSITNPTSKLSQSEVMALLLYAYEPRKLSMMDLKKAVSQAWRAVEMTALGAVMANTLKGRVINEGIRGKYLYSLSGSGREFVRNIISKLKASSRTGGGD